MPNCKIPPNVFPSQVKG